MHVDIHAHLFHDAFNDDREDVLRRAEDNDVTVVNNGLDPTTNTAAKQLARHHQHCHATAGLYPEEAQRPDQDQKQAAYQQMRDNEFIGIGEVGLDYGYASTEDERQRQRTVFKEALAISKEERKPIIVHSRNAEEAVLDLIDEHGAFGVILHAFTGRKNLWRRATRSGHVFSIPCVAHRSTHFQTLIDETPSYQLLTETDAPYLGRVKNERSEPVHVLDTATLIDDIKEARIDQVMADTYNQLF